MGPARKRAEWYRMELCESTLEPPGIRAPGRGPGEYHLEDSHGSNTESRLTALPTVLVVGFVVGLQLYSWLGVIVALPGNALSLYYLAQTLVIYRGI